MISSYFIGFRDRNVAQRKGTLVLDILWIASFGLAIPNSNAWRKEGWNQDTSGWKW